MRNTAQVGVSLPQSPVTRRNLNLQMLTGGAFASYSLNRNSHYKTGPSVEWSNWKTCFKTYFYYRSPTHFWGVWKKNLYTFFALEKSLLATKQKKIIFKWTKKIKTGYLNSMNAYYIGVMSFGLKFLRVIVEEQYTTRI